MKNDSIIQKAIQTLFKIIKCLPYQILKIYNLATNVKRFNLMIKF